MNKLPFCPQCGKQSLAWTDDIKWHCENCDFVLFHSCVAAVAIVVKYEDEILFTRRNQNPGKNLLDLPGGFVDPNESAESAAKRELKEELNLSIDPFNLKYLCSLPNDYHYKGIDYRTLDLFFEYTTHTKDEMRKEQKEISDILWISKNNLTLNELAFDSQKKFFSSYLS